MAILRTAIVILAALLASACAVFPVQGAIKDSAVKELTPYVSTLEDMIVVAGEPRMIWANRRIALFDDGDTMGWIAGSPGGGGSGTFAPKIFLVRFDENGVITQIEKKSHPGERYSSCGLFTCTIEPPDWPSFIREWADAPPPLPQPPPAPEADVSA